MTLIPRGGRKFAAACLITLLLVAPVWAESPTVEELLTRLFSSEIDEFELTADFSARLTLIVRGSRVAATAEGSFREWRKPGEPRRRKVVIDRLEVPLLLRPFTGSLRKIIEEKIETTQTENQETFHSHDVFMLQELPGRQYVLAGVHRSIVDDAISRYGKSQDKNETATRRRIAHWLFTTPNMRRVLVRSGPPYAMRAVIDEEGHLLELILFYDWGKIGTKIAWTVVDGFFVWRHVVSDTAGDLSGIGHVEGDLVLSFNNHCVNCATPPSPRR